MKIINQLKPECDMCPNFVLDANTETEDYFFGDGRYLDQHVTINCRNRELCDHLRRYLANVNDGKEQPRQCK